MFDFLLLFGCVAVLQSSILAWRRLSHSWDSWFPLLRRLVESLLWLGVAGGAIAAVAVALKFQVSVMAGAGAVGAGLLVPMLALRALAPQEPKERTARGAVIAEPEQVAKQVKASIKKEKKSADLVLGGVPIPVDAEPYHFLISGSTGSGKSVAIKGILDTLRDRGDTVILVDSGGEFMSKYWNDDLDIMINPFDARCAPWSPLAEIDGPWDTGSLARSMIPDGVGDNKEWNSYAQTFLSSCMEALYREGRTGMKDLLWAVQQASMKELQPLLAGTAAAGQLGSEKMFGSIRTIAGNYLTSYAFLEDDPSGGFSVSEFVKHANGNFLYLTYRDDQLDSIRHMLSCILDIAARAILSLTPNSSRRVWLIIDEFASIGKVQSIEAVATKARKVGGCLLLGLQSISQLKDRYGEHQAQSILSCLSNSLILRCSDGDTAELMSRTLGEADVIRAAHGGNSNNSGADTRSWNEQKTTERLVLPSELQQLKNLDGFLKISGEFPVCKIHLTFPRKRDDATLPFDARDFRTSFAAPVAATPAAHATAVVPPAQSAAHSVAPQRTIPRMPAAHMEGLGAPHAPARPMQVAEPAPAPVSTPIAATRAAPAIQQAANAAHTASAPKPAGPAQLVVMLRSKKPASTPVAPTASAVAAQAPTRLQDSAPEPASRLAPAQLPLPARASPAAKQLSPAPPIFDAAPREKAEATPVQKQETSSSSDFSKVVAKAMLEDKFERNTIRTTKPLSGAHGARAPRRNRPGRAR